MVCAGAVLSVDDSAFTVMPRIIPQIQILRMCDGASMGPRARAKLGFKKWGFLSFRHCLRIHSGGVMATGSPHIYAPVAVHLCPRKNPLCGRGG